MIRNQIAIAKGIQRDEYLDVTTLAEYCRERGWVIAREFVIIEKPKGSTLTRFNKDVKESKIIIIQRGR